MAVPAVIESVSVPSPPATVSFAVRVATIVKVSSPAPPDRLSLPAADVMLSLPAPPEMTSLPAAPASMSLPVPPVMVLDVVLVPVAVSAAPVKLVPAMVVMVVLSAPRVRLWSPVIFKVVALVAVKPVNTLSEVLVAMLMVSTPAMVTVPAVTPERLSATESVVADTAEVAKPKLAPKPVSVTFKVRPVSDAMFVNAAAAVELTASRLVMPVEFSRDSVPAAVNVVEMVSIVDRVGAEVPVVLMVAVRVSAPAPPTNTSPVPRVRRPPTNEPSNVSIPEAPVNVFRPVVSGQVKCRRN